MNRNIPKSLQRLKSTARAIGFSSSDGKQLTIFEMSLVVTSRFVSARSVSMLVLYPPPILGFTVVSDAVPNYPQILFS